MTPLQYLLSIQTNDHRRILGLAVQMGIVMMAIYAGTIYPPYWISRMYLYYYIPSVLPFAVIVAFTIVLAIYKESRIPYNEPEEENPGEDGPDNEKDNIAEAQRSS